MTGSLSAVRRDGDQCQTVSELGPCSSARARRSSNVTTLDLGQLGGRSALQHY
jgi:hypothetical protein